MTRPLKNPTPPPLDRIKPPPRPRKAKRVLDYDEENRKILFPGIKVGEEDIEDEEDLNDEEGCSECDRMYEEIRLRRMV